MTTLLPAGGHWSTQVIGVGVAVTTRTAVIAVVHNDPLRWVGVAELTWPVGLWGPEPPHSAAPAARQTLVRARRRLRLPKVCPVSVVTEEGVPGSSAALFAKAGLPHGWLTTLHRAARLWSTMDCGVDPALASASGSRQVRAAVGAALAVFQPPVAPPQPFGIPAQPLGVVAQPLGVPAQPLGVPVPVPEPAPAAAPLPPPSVPLPPPAASPTSVPDIEPEEWDHDGGWAVQPVDETVVTIKPNPWWVEDDGNGRRQ